MDSSFQTPSPTTSPNVATGQLIFSDDVSSDQFIEDLYGSTSTGSRTLPEPRISSSLGPTPASEVSVIRAHFSPADPDRLQADCLVRLSTLAVSVIDGLDRHDYSMQDFQRDAVAIYKDLLPTTQDTALLPLLKFFSSILFLFILVELYSCLACVSWSIRSFFFAFSPSSFYSYPPI